MSDDQQDVIPEGFVRIIGAKPISSSDVPSICTREGAQRLVDAGLAEWVADEVRLFPEKT